MDIDVMDCLFGTLMAIFCAEAIAWLPRLTRRIVRTAAKRLSSDLQERMEEEWLRYVEDIPGTLSPFTAACQCLFASAKIQPVRINFGIQARLNNFFRPRDIFLHDGKTLRRYTIGSKMQAAAATAVVFLLAWSGEATYSAIMALDGDLARMEQEVAQMEQDVQAYRASQGRPQPLE